MTEFEPIGSKIRAARLAADRDKEFMASYFARNGLKNESVLFETYFHQFHGASAS